MQRGGVRKGAGRPNGTGMYGTKTVPIRVPIVLLENYKLWVKEALKRQAEQNLYTGQERRSKKRGG